MPKSTNRSTRERALDEALRRSVVRSAPRSGTVAVSIRGVSYASGCIESETHLLDIPSELGALARAVYANDPYIALVHTKLEHAVPPSPLALKVLADHGARTSMPIRYVVETTGGKILFDGNVMDALPLYESPLASLSILSTRTVQKPRAKRTKAPIETQLREHALRGISRNFPVRDKASGYGAAILTKKGFVYSAGQYSLPDQRLGLHAEMGVVLEAIMSGDPHITHLGIASTKHTEVPCTPCGACRQFLGEMAKHFGWNVQIHVFASESDASAAYALEELLPVQWTSQK